MKQKTQKQILDELIEFFTDTFKKNGKKEMDLSKDAKNALDEIQNNRDLMYLAETYGNEGSPQALSKTYMKGVLITAIKKSRLPN